MRLSPAAIVVGSAFGLGTGIVVAIPLLGFGVADTETTGGQAILILVGFSAQFLAGYTGARLAKGSSPVNGGLAALLLYGVVAGLAVASGTGPGIPTLAFSGAVALVLGSSAGILAEARNVPPPT